MIYWKGLSGLQRLNSDKVCTCKSFWWKEKRVSKIIHVDQGIIAFIQGKTGTGFTLPNEMTKGINKIYEILVFNTLSIKQQKTVMSMKQELYEVSSIIAPM